MLVVNMNPNMSQVLHKVCFNQIKENKTIQICHTIKQVSQLTFLPLIISLMFGSILVIFIQYSFDHQLYHKDVIRISYFTIFFALGLYALYAVICDICDNYMSKKYDAIINEIILPFIQTVSYANVSQCYQVGYGNLLSIFENIVQSTILQKSYKIDVIISRGAIVIFLPIILVLFHIYIYIAIHFMSEDENRIQEPYKFGAFGVNINGGLWKYLKTHLAIRFGGLSFSSIAITMLNFMIQIIVCNIIFIIIERLVKNTGRIYSIEDIYSSTMNDQKNEDVMQIIEAIYYGVIVCVLFLMIIVNTMELFIFSLPSNKWGKDVISYMYCISKVILASNIHIDIEITDMHNLSEELQDKIAALVKLFQKQQGGAIGIEEHGDFNIPNIITEKHTIAKLIKHEYTGQTIMMPVIHTITNLLSEVQGASTIAFISMLCYNYSIYKPIESDLQLMKGIRGYVFIQSRLPMLLQLLRLIYMRNRVVNENRIGSLYGFYTLFDQVSYKVIGYSEDVGYTTEEFVVLNDSYVRADLGDILLIKGPSGSGKTTLINHIMGRNTNYGNTTLLTTEEEINSLDIDAQQIIDRIYYFPQIFQGINGRLTLQEVIKFLNIPNKNIPILKHILSIFSIDSIPWNRQYNTLSGGQKKRFDYAIIIAKNIDKLPSMAFVDEFQGLDIAKRQKVLSFFINLNLVHEEYLLKKYKYSGDVSKISNIAKCDPVTLTIIAHTPERPGSITKSCNINSDKNIEVTSHFNSKVIKYQKGNTHELFNTGVK